MLVNVPVIVQVKEVEGFLYLSNMLMIHLIVYSQPIYPGPEFLMIIPVRCFTCGSITGNKWDRYLALLQADYTEGYLFLIIYNLEKHLTSLD